MDRSRNPRGPADRQVIARARAHRCRESRPLARAVHAALLAALHFSSNSWAGAPPGADDHALPCRPTIACTADVVPAGTAEIELGYLARNLPGNVWQQTVPLLLKFTLTPLIQLQVGSNGPTLQRRPIVRTYLDDVEVGGKFHLLDQSTWVPSLALSGALSIPTFAAAGYIRIYDMLLTAYATKDIGWLHADLNLGFDLWRVQEPLSQLWAALALSFPLAGPLGGMVEGYYFTDASPIASRDGGILMALALTPLSWLVIDVGGDIGFVAATRRFSLFVGLTVVPYVFWR